MKMNYPLKSSNLKDRQRNAQKKVLIVIIFLAIVLVIFSTSPFKKVFFVVAEPVWKIKNSIVNSNMGDYFKSKQTLTNERIALEQKLFMAGNLLAQNSILEKENEVFKDLLGRKEITKKTILASVLVKPPQTPYDMFVVDIGADQQIKVGDKVIASANVYIGEVAEVMSNSSKIILYSSPGNKLPVLLGENSVSVEAVGIGGGNYNIFVPREVEVKENDIITLPSINANVFGIVEKVNFNDKDSSQTVIFKSPINIFELNWVEIIIE